MTDYRALAERIDSEEFDPFLPESIDDMLDWLQRDGDLRVQCSRYGRFTSDTAPWAVACVLIGIDANGTRGMAPMTDALKYEMGLVVNDSDGPLELVLGHGECLSSVDHIDISTLQDDAAEILVENLLERIKRLPLPRLREINEEVSRIEQLLREEARP